MKTSTMKPLASDPLEVKLVFEVRACRTCKFFWPENNPQPYGPFTSFDFKTNFPDTNTPPDQKGEKYPKPWPWVNGITRQQSFPKPEVMDGCRKAPIMTIGINPNLTAFAPGQQGTSWCYPEFTSDDGTNEWAKYAFYYRYRTVYQECLDLPFIEKYLLKDGQIVAEADGKMVSAERPTDSPDFDLVVQYDDREEKTTIPLKRELGTSRYVLLYNTFDDNNAFKKGDVIAAKLDVPGGVSAEVNQQQIGYYEQIVPVLSDFDRFLKAKGHNDADLKVGEDVCQLDMVACASPHWNPGFMGGEESENTVINNCVSDHIWAIKQFVQTDPAVLFLVGESTYHMFNDAFGNYIKCDPPIPSELEDNAFTLLEHTTKNECYFEFNGEVNGRQASIKTRLVATPHFSYNSNFVPQFRMKGSEFDSFKSSYASCYDYLKSNGAIKIVEAEKSYEYSAIQINEDAKGVFAKLKTDYTDALETLMPYFVDAHTAMAKVLEGQFEDGKLAYTDGSGGEEGYLTRGNGGCKFCVNQHWEFPQGCPYNKPNEVEPDASFLEGIAKALVAGGKLNQ